LNDGGLSHAAGDLPFLGPWASLGVGLILVALNGFFVAAEFALVKVRPTQLDPHVSRGSRRARAARHMLDHLDAYLSATQLGITLASLGLGWVGEPAFAWLVGPVIGLLPGASPAVVSTASVTVAFLVITTLHIVIGEQAPKTLAIRESEAAALVISLPLLIFYKLTYPIIWVLNRSANGVLRLVGVQPVAEGDLGHDEGELRLLLASAAPGRLSKQKWELLDNIFELSERSARQIMLPRADVVYLSTTRSLAENLAIARQSGHTRFPLCDGDLDHAVGLVHIKDLFRTGEGLASLEQVARKLAFVPETLELDRLLRRMRTERLHMAAVVDEYGGVSGIVTMENVIEEIVGSIQDEFDREKPELTKAGRNVYVVSGGMLVDDLEQALGLELSDRDEDTLGGVVLSELGGTPTAGAHVELGPVDLEILEVDGHRIKSVRVTVKEPAPAEV
jgi:magnesium and cobalt exporter, CNNM family